MLRLRIPPATVVISSVAAQPPAEAPSQRSAALGQEDTPVAELREQLGVLTEAVRNEFLSLHESFEVISSRVQEAEISLANADVVQLAAALESEALLQQELANVAVRVEQLSHREAVDGEALM